MPRARPAPAGRSRRPAGGPAGRAREVVEVRRTSCSLRMEMTMVRAGSDKSPSRLRGLVVRRFRHGRDARNTSESFRGGHFKIHVAGDLLVGSRNRYGAGDLGLLEL